MLPFSKRLARSSAYRKFARAPDVFVRVAIETADTLPPTFPLLSFEDLRSLTLQCIVMDVFSPYTMEGKFDIPPTRLAKQLQRANTIDAKLRTEFNNLYQEKLENRLGMSG